MAPHLAVISQLGVALYVFVMGLELNTDLLRQRTSSSIAISHASFGVPFLLRGMSAWLYPRYAMRNVSFAVFALFRGVAMSVTGLSSSGTHSHGACPPKESSGSNRAGLRCRRRHGLVAPSPACRRGARRRRAQCRSWEVTDEYLEWDRGCSPLDRINAGRDCVSGAGSHDPLVEGTSDAHGCRCAGAMMKRLSFLTAVAETLTTFMPSYDEIAAKRRCYRPPAPSRFLIGFCLG